MTVNRHWKYFKFSVEIKNQESSALIQIFRQSLDPENNFAN